jgi:hypothetical protein
MAGIDLTHIIFRAHEVGDVDTSKNIPNTVGGSTGISLAGIKFRSKEYGDNEE